MERLEGVFAGYTYLLCRHGRRRTLSGVYDAVSVMSTGLVARRGLRMGVTLQSFPLFVQPLQPFLKPAHGCVHDTITQLANLVPSLHTFSKSII